MKPETNTAAPDCTASTLSLAPEQKEKAIKVLKDLNVQLEFFEQLIATDKAYRDDVTTHLGLFRHKFSDLSSALDGGMTISKELDETRAMLRDANGRVHLLEKRLGAETSCESAIAKLEAMEYAFETWYGLCGFHYASITHGTRALSADFSTEVERFNSEDERADVTFGDKQLARTALPFTGYVFDPDTWDLFDNNGRLEIRDSDANRSNVAYLFRDAFPHARVTSFASRPDHGKFRLKFTVHVPYADIDEWERGMLERAAKETADHCRDIEEKDTEHTA